jgi:hypothetical protein
MFLKNSRYYKLKQVETDTSDLLIKAVTLRRLPPINGSPQVVKSNDRLDIMAQQQYNDETMFWHIVDANSKLQANELVKEPGQTIEVPGK